MYKNNSIKLKRKLPKRFSKDKFRFNYSTCNLAVKYLLSGLLTDIFIILIISNLK